MHLPISKCLLNVHTPSYKKTYRQQLDSQKAYAVRHGYLYDSVSLPEDDPGQAKWHKIACLAERLEAYDAVLMLDADCHVREDAPDVCGEIVEGKVIYMARGHSGRFNSGVILALRADKSKRFFQEVLASRGSPVPPQDLVTSEGENSHIIVLARDPLFSGLIQELDYRWNNNRFPDRVDYIRHFSGGPMKKHFRGGVTPDGHLTPGAVSKTERKGVGERLRALFGKR
jgi:hypothetical protein